MQKNAVVKFCKLREKLFHILTTQAFLLCDGKRVTKKSEIKQIVAKAFNENKFGGSKS